MRHPSENPHPQPLFHPTRRARASSRQVGEGGVGLSLFEAEWEKRSRGWLAVFFIGFLCATSITAVTAISFSKQEELKRPKSARAHSI